MKDFGNIQVPIEDQMMVRQMSSKAIVSTDKKGLDAYKDRKITMETLIEKNKEFEDIKREMQEIKNMLAAMNHHKEINS